MKRVLITGVNSYIGNAAAEAMMQKNAAAGGDRYQVERISLRDRSWEKLDFAKYDSIIHVSGKAHADVGKATPEQAEEYYRINSKLPVAVALKARAEGVGQFIYLSSVIVYGESAPVGKQKHITGQSRPAPVNCYGDSKRQAEIELEKLARDSFQIAILRLPMVYGRGSKGNFALLEKIAGRFRVFPWVKNHRSMLYIENLCEFLCRLVDRADGGYFYPQNREYVCTADMVRLIGEAKGKKIHLWCAWNILVLLASKVPGKVGKLCNKAFGSLTIDHQLSSPEGYDYQRYSLEESVRRIYENQCGDSGL